MFSYPFRSWIGYTLTFAVITAVGLYARLFPLREYTSDRSRQQATVLVLNNLNRSIQKRFTAAPQDIPPAQQTRLARQAVNNILSADSRNALKTIHSVARRLELERNSPRPSPYLQGSDSYYYLSLTQSLLENGHLPGPIKGSKYFNPLMVYPRGHWEPLTLHPFLGAGLHHILSGFNAPSDPMSSVSWVPLIMTIFSCALFVILSRQLQLSWIPTLAGGIFFVLSPVFIERSLYGWYDNDPYNVFFPLFILSLFWAAVTSAASSRRSYIYAAATGLCVTFYALFWQGWVFLGATVLICALLLKAMEHIRGTKHHAEGRLFLTTLLTMTAGISLIFGFREFFVLFREGWTALQNFWNPPLHIWPDLYIAVGELHNASPADIIQLMGGWAYGVLTISGIGAALWDLSSFRAHKIRAQRSVVLLTVFAGTLFLALGARRFILLNLIPSSLFIVLALQRFSCLLGRFLNRLIKHPAWLQKILRPSCQLLLAALLLIPLKNTLPELLFMQHRIYNDTWHEAMSFIHKKTPENSVINAWWPPGHFIKAVGRRAVTFDGATINATDQAYWLASALMSGHERESLGFLRMLNSHDNHAVEYLQSAGFSVSKSVRVLKSILPLNRQEAKNILIPQLSSAQADELLDFTHAEPPPTYLMLTNELIEKNILLSFVAGWDFAEIENIRSDPKKQQRVPPAGSKEYVRFLWRISGGQPLYSGMLSPIDEDAEHVIFQGGVNYNKKTHSISIQSDTFGKGVPQSVFYNRGNKIIRFQPENATLGYSAIVSNTSGRFRCALMSNRLARSLLMNLHYFGAESFPSIKSVFERRDFTGQTSISIYRISFE
ncbi:MAG: STT3 domain-containing protein [Candidatus Omnitrophota bacterium]